MPQQSRWILAVFTPQTSVSNPQMAKTLSFVFEHILQSWSFPESLKLLQQSWDRAVDGDCELCLNCRWPCKDPLIIYLFSGHRKGRMICGHWCDGPRAVEQEYLDPRSIKMCVCVCSGPCLFLSNSFYLFMDTLRVSRESPAPQSNRAAALHAGVVQTETQLAKTAIHSACAGSHMTIFGVSTCIGALNF